MFSAGEKQCSYMLSGTGCAGRKYPGTTIVTDSVTSNGLTTFIESQVGHTGRISHHCW